jgi:hypothetical protein
MTNRRFRFPRAYSTVAPCTASPTGWVEIADEWEPSPGVLRRLTRRELLRNPYVRPLSARDAAEAERIAAEE